MGTKRNRKKLDKSHLGKTLQEMATGNFSIHTSTWPSCGECDREFSPDQDETITDGSDFFSVGDSVAGQILFGWRCTFCESLNYAAGLEEP